MNTNASFRSAAAKPAWLKVKPAWLKWRAVFGLVALWGGLWAGAGWVGTARGQQETPSPPEAQPGLLLLHNGQALRGKLLLSGAYWIVYVPEGEIRIRASEVDAPCHTADEAYLRLRSTTALFSANDHLRLAQWCLREKLLDRAEGEIREAKSLEPDHPMVEVLQRRLALSRQPPMLPVSAKAAPLEVTTDDLDRMVRGISPQTMEQFAQRIQPLLVNNCTSAGCHGPQSATGFRLSRVTLDQPPSRRVTQRNLHAVLQWINHDDPAASKLLSVPLEPHGTARAAIFSDQQSAAYQRLLEWVYLAASRAADAPTLVEHVTTTPGSPWPEAPVMNASTPAAVNGAAGGVVPAGYNAPIAHQPASRSSRRHYGPPTPADSDAPDQTPAGKDGQANPTGDDNPSGAGVRPRHAALPGGATPPNVAPADPFDPEVFNRRTAGQ